jgi:D-amino-acid dehydrogenase
VRVSVVGGGVIGLGVAYELVRAGTEVTVLERARLGSGASLGNAGWVSPALSAAPVPGPGVTAQVLRWMFRSDSPFLLRPRIDPGFVGWLWSFQRACRAPQYAAGMRALVEHNRHAIDSLLRWQQEGVEFELHRSGLLFAALGEAALREERELYVRLQAAGFPVEFELLDADALRTREPAISARVIGGMLSRGEWHLRPESLTAGLAAALRAAGAELVEGVVVEDLAPKEGGWRLTTSSGPRQAERVVLATGAWGHSLLGPLGYRLPLEAAKGYSITAPGDGIRPRHAVYLLEAKVGCSPYADAVRLAGTLELAGLDLSLNRPRLRAIERAAERYLRWRPVDPQLEWAGLRPLAPDGLPVVGAVPGHSGLFLATGHGMAGVTLAAASASLLAPFVLGGHEPPELRPLSPGRFRRRRSSVARSTFRHRLYWCRGRRP